MSASLAHHIGCYEWDGRPCRIVEDAEQPGVLRAEIYVAGKGFSPIDVFTVIQKASPVGEEEFKRLVIARTRRKGG